MSDETEYRDKNDRKNIFMPLAYSLLWAAGLIITSYLTLTKTKLSYTNSEFQTVIKFGIVFALFLLEIALRFMNISYIHSNKHFSSKVFKTMGYIIGDITIALILAALYVVLKQPVYLLCIIATSAILKYIYVNVSQNVGTYFAENTYKPNHINHG